MDCLKEHKIHLVSLTENIDTSNPMGHLMFHIMCAIAEFERSLIKERTIADLEIAKKNKRLGRPQKLDKNKIRLVKELRENSTLSVQEIAR